MEITHVKISLKVVRHKHFNEIMRYIDLCGSTMLWAIETVI